MSAASLLASFYASAGFIRLLRTRRRSGSSRTACLKAVSVALLGRSRAGCAYCFLFFPAHEILHPRRQKNTCERKRVFTLWFMVERKKRINAHCACPCTPLGDGWLNPFTHPLFVLLLDDKVRVGGAWPFLFLSSRIKGPWRQIFADGEEVPIVAP